MTTLTCITTVYNDGPDLMCSLGSVLGQTDGDVEYIVVDDGSGPETRARLAALDDPRILRLEQANDGLSSARNRALHHATGAYVCFLDADDVRAPWSFAAIRAAIAAEAPDVLLCAGMLSEVRGNLLPFYDTHIFETIARAGGGPIRPGAPEARARLALAQLLEPQSANKVVRTALLREARIGFPNGHFFEDVYFHTLALARAERVSFLGQPMFTYFRRYGRPQITAAAGDRRFDILAVAKLTLERFADTPGFHDPWHRTAVVASVARIARWCGEVISHQHRAAYAEVVAGLVRLVDPLCFHLAEDAPPELAPLLEPATYFREMLDADA